MDDYEGGEVKVVGKRNKSIKTLWERIKKPAKGQKASFEDSEVP